MQVASTWREWSVKTPRGRCDRSGVLRPQERQRLFERQSEPCWFSAIHLSQRGGCIDGITPMRDRRSFRMVRPLIVWIRKKWRSQEEENSRSARGKVALARYSLTSRGLVGSIKFSELIFVRVVLYYKSKRYCPVLVVQQGGGLCIFP